MRIPLSSSPQSYQKYQIKSGSDLLGVAKSNVIMKARNSEVVRKYY